MRLAFYKGGRGAKRRFVGWLIQKWTKGPYEHTEVDFEAPVGPNGENCFSASGYDGGCRWKPIGFSHLDRWDFVDIPPKSDAEVEAMTQHCNKHDGDRYDFRGIFLHQFLHFGIQDPTKWWCSECDAHVTTLKPETVSPIELYRIATAVFSGSYP